MRRIIGFTLGITGLLLLSSCATTSANKRDQEKEGDRAVRNVRVTTNPEVVRGCKFLGNVRDSAESCAFCGDAAAKLEEKLARKTVSLGGNVLMTAPMTSGGQLWNGHPLTAGSGEAYLCTDSAAAVKE
jgi:hypothetical protein